METNTFPYFILENEIFTCLIIQAIKDNKFELIG